MSVTHLDFGIVQRTRPGRTDAGSAVSAAAYNACARFQQRDRVYDFTRKREEHVGQFVLLPPGSPPSFAHPESLWRAAEEAERRADAQTARQVLITVPREVPEDLRLPLIRAIAEPWVADGMACQADLHNVAAADGQEQPHAHLLLSLRRVTDAGFAPTKERTWNREFRAGEGRDMRKAIETRGNIFLAAHGLPALLDYSRRPSDDLPPEPSAPQEDWQAWKRTGADPEAAPASVGAVLVHRQRRKDLRRAEADVAAAATEAAALNRQLSSIGSLKADPRVPASEATSWEAPTRRSKAGPVSQHPPNSPVSAAAPAVENRPAKQGTTASKEDMMAKSPRRAPAREKKQYERWMGGEGGLDALTDAHRQSAERSYSAWAESNPKAARSHDLGGYVDYVQEQHARRRREQEQQEAEQQPAARPEEPSARTAARVSRHATISLGDAPPPVPGPGWSARRDHETGATHYRTPEDGRIADHGDRLEPAAGTDPVRLVELARAKGWPGLRLDGPDDFKTAVSRAAALAEPPIATDHPLPAEAQREISAALVQRAASRVEPMDVGAIRATAATDPAAAARSVLDQREAHARLVLSGQPSGETDPAELAQPRFADLLEKREEARETAKEAREAATGHRDEHGWTARLLDPSARRRQAALDDEAQRLDRESRRLDWGFERSERKIERDAEKMARTNKQAHDDWRWSGPVRRAEQELKNLAVMRTAVDGGSSKVVEAVARGDLRMGLAAGQTWEDGAPERKRQEEEERRKTDEREQRETEERQRVGESPHETAVRLSLAGELAAAGNPEKLKWARSVTAAVAGHDEGTVSSVLSHGAGHADTHQSASAFHGTKRAAEKGSALVTRVSGMITSRISEAAGLGM